MAQEWTNQLHATEHNTVRGDHPYRCEIRTVIGELIAIASASDRNKAEDRARLIAAAPALLEAARGITACAHFRGPADISAYAINEDRMDALNVAIKAATEQTP